MKLMKPKILKPSTTSSPSAAMTSSAWAVLGDRVYFHSGIPVQQVVALTVVVLSSRVATILEVGVGEDVIGIWKI